MNPIDAAREVLMAARAAAVFPAATAEAGDSAAPLWREALGTLTFEPGSPSASAHTPFDLASLTKVIATTSLVMRLVRDGSLSLDEPIAAAFAEWRGTDRDEATVRDLLEHASGMAARLIDPPGVGRREFEHDICTAALECKPRSKAIYSDLGFILLGFLIADRGGAPLAPQLDRLLATMLDTPSTDAADVLAFNLSADLGGLAAPTVPMPDDLRRGRLLVGEVHDNYAAALGGAAGHAGLFGTAGAVGAFARVVLRAARGDATMPEPFAPDLVSAFTTRSAVPGSSRALGWDTMLPTSSCGTRMSASAFGHVGFTGTSLWIDPARDRYFVLLANRAAGAAGIEEMRRVRRAFHDALGDL